MTSTTGARRTAGGSGRSIARFGGSGASGSIGVREESRSPGASTRNFSPCIRSSGPISLVLGPVRGVRSEEPSAVRSGRQGCSPAGERPGAACTAVRSCGGRTRRRNCPVRRRSHTRLLGRATALGASSGVQVPAARCRWASRSVRQGGASNFEGRSRGDPIAP